MSSFATISERFSEFNAQNVILLSTKISERSSKQTRLAKYFIKVIVHLSFGRLRAIMQINNFINIKIKDILQRVYLKSFI